MYNEQLANETLIEASEYIKKILVAIDEVLGQFLAGREDQALKEFPNIADGFEWLLDVISLTEPTQKKLEVEFKDVARLLEILNEMIEALQNSDYVLLGDLLNYEAKPIIEDWQSQFKIVGERLALT